MQGSQVEVDVCLRRNGHRGMAVGEGLCGVFGRSVAGECRNRAVKAEGFELRGVRMIRERVGRHRDDESEGYQSMVYARGRKDTR